MAYHVSDNTRQRLELIDNYEESYNIKKKLALELQDDTTSKFIKIMEQRHKGSEHFLLESHKRFMKDIGKRNLVISRLNQDLDCVDIRDP